MSRITAFSKHLKHLDSTGVTPSNPGVSYQNIIYLYGIVNWSESVFVVSGVSNGVIVNAAEQFEPMRVIAS